MLPEMGGLEVLDELKKTRPRPGGADDHRLRLGGDGASPAMKKGAFDYVTKPFKHEEVLHILRNGLNQRRLQDENRAAAHARCATRRRFTEIVGKSPRMQQVFSLITQAAPSAAPPSWWWARAARARSWWPRPSTPTARARTSPSSW